MTEKSQKSQVKKEEKPKPRTKWLRERFLAKFLYYHAIGKAAQATGVSRRTVYRWIERSKRFAADFEDARLEIVEALEVEADRRAQRGVLKPVYFKGNRCGSVREYSDTLLMFRLKALDPAKYRERYEFTGKDGGPVEIREIIVNLPEV